LANNAGSQDDQVCIKVEGLWKIFGPDAEQVLNSEKLRTATRDEILEKTGCVVAVRNISFNVNRGELFVVMGLSGSGKSTLIRCILRLIEPTAGKIFIDGEDICTYSQKQLAAFRRHKISMIFQHFGLFPHCNVIDNVAYGLKVRGAAEQERYAKAQQVIEKVGLKGWEEYYPDALSGGMQQRVGIARALTNDPEMLLMDEPFSGLDPLIRRQMQDELIDLQAELKKTILFVTHDLDEALKLGNYIAIMKDGEIIQTGIPEEVVTSPAGEYVREFVQDASPAKVITAGSIMTEPDVIIYDWQGPKAALHLLKTSKRDHGFLVTRGRKYLGLVSASSLSKLIKDNGKSTSQAIEPDIATCTDSTLLEDLFPLAVTTRFPIPVVDDQGKLIGEIENETIISSMIQFKEVEDKEPEAKEIETAETPAKEAESNA
jgi:glycine betaine/proline transport system ATP-binding protein